MKPNFEALADGLYRGVDLGKDLMFAFVEQPVPQDDFRILDEQPPELDEIAVAGPFPGERIPHKLIELKIAFVRAIEVDAALARGFLVVAAEASDARRRDTLRVAGAKRV